MAADSTDPQWGESLSLPFTPPRGDFAPSALSAVADQISLELYDQIIFQNPVVRPPPSVAGGAVGVGATCLTGP